MEHKLANISEFYSIFAVETNLNRCLALVLHSRSSQVRFPNPLFCVVLIYVITSPIIHVKRHPHAISMFSIQFKHLPNNWQYNINPYVVFYSLSAVLYTIRSCCTGVLWLATWFSLNVPPATSTNWFQPQFDCHSLFYFVSPKKRKEDSNSSEGSSHTCEVMPSVKIFQV